MAENITRHDYYKARILAGLVSNPSIIAPHPNCGWAPVNCDWADLVGWADGTARLATGEDETRRMELAMRNCRALTQRELRHNRSQEVIEFAQRILTFVEESGLKDGSLLRTGGMATGEKEDETNG